MLMLTIRPYCCTQTASAKRVSIYAKTNNHANKITNANHIASSGLLVLLVLTRWPSCQSYTCYPANVMEKTTQIWNITAGQPRLPKNVAG